MAERNAPIADFFSNLWPDEWGLNLDLRDPDPNEIPRSSWGTDSPTPGNNSLSDFGTWLDNYWDGRGPGDTPRGLRGERPMRDGYSRGDYDGPNYRSPSSEERRALNRDRNRSAIASTPDGGGGGNGGSGGGQGGQGGGNGNGGRGRGRMTFRDFIRYQNQQNQQIAAQAEREQRQSVYDWVRTSFQQWGMPDGFADRVIDITRNARTPEQILLEVRDTPEYKQRFAGNIARAKAGYGMLSEAEYLGMESSYRQALRAAGLPERFYDKPEDFANWISGDVSPSEIQARAEMAGDLAQRRDPKLWKELESRGITKGDAAAYLLNPDKALPAIQKKLASAEIGVAAREAGMKFGTKFENLLVDKGVDAGQARQAFQAVAEDEADLDALAARYGEKEFGTKALAKGELGVGGAKAKKRRRELASRERAAWSGGGGSSTVFGNNSF